MLTYSNNIVSFIIQGLPSGARALTGPHLLRHWRISTHINDGYQWRSEGTLRPGARNMLASPPTKITESEVKNKCKSAEETKVEHSL